MRLPGKIALITGSTKHTGFEIAKKFLGEGATVIINGRQERDVKESAEKLRRQEKGLVLEAPGDISHVKDVERIFAFIQTKCETLDILVNNAVHLGVGDYFLETPVELWDEVLAVNLRGLLLCSQKAAQIMAMKKRGVIINISSLTSLQAVRNRCAYITSKGAINSATRALAVDLAPYNIRVNCVMPGYIRTTRWDALSTEIIEKRRSNIPLGIEVSYEDVANAVIFLASDEAKNITGAQLAVDGGCTAQLVPFHSDC
jgi:NAD(P)-dependent dehydrogenase (short-subunit alcohol dehydrogenase family)